MKTLTTLSLCALLAGCALAQNRAPLQPRAFDPLPLTSVKPRGWLLRQLRIQADGLSGHLDEGFWKSLDSNSGWLGGDGESWERGPYYLDGLVPLAFLLDDPKLIAKAKTWVEWTLAHQREDGAIGPLKNEDWWPNYVMLKALTQYFEATGDARVVPLMERYVAYQNAHLAERPLKEWAVYRWADEVVSLVWLYNRTGNAAALELARKLHDQGYDWNRHFANFLYHEKVAKGHTNLGTHGVNNAMAMKTAAVWWQISGQASDREAIYQMLKELDRYHLLPSGAHSADEHYAGLDPSQGTELCAVVEAMFSLEQAVAILGDPALSDRLEKLAYNALPGTFTADMWAHQYDQQPNQVLCSHAPRQWVDNGPDSNLYGLEPNFGCCTANFHQGWPKLVASLWMATPDHGLAAAAYGPNQVETVAGNGVRVVIEEQTEYPFRGTVRLLVTPAMPTRFPLLLRIPAWAAGTTITVNGKPEANVKAGTFHRLDRRWIAGDRVQAILPLRVRTTRWYHNSAALERGPLVFSLAIGEDWRKLHHWGPAADWEVRPSTAWNYALDLAGTPEVLKKPVGDFPFSTEGTPLEMHVRGRRLPGWQMERNSAGPLPASPVSSTEPLETLTLIPYGAAKLRITAFPVLGAANTRK